MVKKVVKQASLNKATKNHHESKQLNNLIKVLRPKVYITDTSNFKRLVQELTGNGGNMVSNSMPSPPPPPPIQIPPQLALDDNYFPVLIDVDEDYHHHHGELQNCTEAISFDASLDSFDNELCNQVGDSTTEGRLLTEANNQIHLMYPMMDDQWTDTFNGTTTYDVSSMGDQWADLLAYQDLESWLLDVDHPYPNNNHLNGFAQNQEVSVYDYEFSGLIS